MKIIFVTHGQTLENAEGIIMGQLIGGKLSPLGRLQAHELGKKLKETKIDSAYCSDLSRAVETVNEIVAFHSGLKLILTKDLRERSFGEYQGRKKNELKELKDNWFTEEHSTFEPIKALCSRVEKFLLKIEKQHKADTVLLVGHRVCGMALECIINQIPISNFNTIIEMKNGEMKVFNFREN